MMTMNTAWCINLVCKIRIHYNIESGLVCDHDLTLEVQVHGAHNYFKPRFEKINRKDSFLNFRNLQIWSHRVHCCDHYVFHFRFCFSELFTALKFGLHNCLFSFHVFCYKVSTENWGRGAYPQFWKSLKIMIVQNLFITQFKHMTGEELSLFLVCRLFYKQSSYC